MILRLHIFQEFILKSFITIIIINDISDLIQNWQCYFLLHTLIYQFKTMYYIQILLIKYSTNINNIFN